MQNIDAALLLKATGLSVSGANYDGLGMADSAQGDALLTFLDHPKYAEVVNSNPSIKGVFVRSAEKCLLRSDIEKITVDDPKWYFFSVVNFLGENRSREKTVIAPTARIDGSAVIAEYGVVIGDGVVVEPRSVIMPDVVIGARVKVRAGAVVGVDGYEHKRTSRGILSVVHDGVVIIEDDVEIGANSFVAKGFNYRATVIGRETKLDALVHYAHGVQCGRRCLIVANAMIAGHVTIGNDVWIGPSASIANRLTIGDGAFVTMGSVVTKDVGEGQKVTGNFAVPHNVFLANLKKAMKND